MHTITTIGLDIAKSVFQVHGVDAAGQVVMPGAMPRTSIFALNNATRPSC
jgi:transposase